MASKQEEGSGTEFAQCPLKEYERLDYIFKSVPQKYQRGLFMASTELTCVDATDEYIAVGTSVGLVYLFDRSMKTYQKLTFPAKSVSISAMKMCNSLDYTVGVGSVTGDLYVFVLPSNLPGRNRQLRVISVLDMHISPISCLEWSPNGSKLFSGDTGGTVVCTELDELMDQGRSHKVAVENAAVVQLSYNYRILLISTTARTILYTASNNKTIQVGKKDRKSPGPYGACFIPDVCQPADAVLFAARPGLRLWKASTDGAVQATYIYRDLIAAEPPGIGLYADTQVNLPRQQIDHQFGPLVVFSKSQRQLVTWNDGSLFVLDPYSGTVIGCCHNLGLIQSVAVNQSEVFILRKGHYRSVIRLASEADPYTLTMETNTAEENKPNYSPDVYSKQSETLMDNMSLPPLPLDVGTNTESPQHVKNSQRLSKEASPIHRMTETASKVSADLFNKLGDMLYKVQDGEKLAGKVTPPWGASVKRVESPVKIETLEGVIDLKVDPNIPGELGHMSQPDVVPNTSDNKLNTQLSCTNSDISESDIRVSHSSTDHRTDHERNDQPTVKLETPDLLTVTMATASDSNNSDSDQQGAGQGVIRTASTKGDVEQTREGRGGVYPRMEGTVLDHVTKEDYGDIVFSQKVKKAKKKKGKQALKNKGTDSDTASIASKDSVELPARGTSNGAGPANSTLGRPVSQDRNTESDSASIASADGVLRTSEDHPTDTENIEVQVLPSAESMVPQPADNNNSDVDENRDCREKDAADSNDANPVSQAENPPSISLSGQGMDADVPVSEPEDTVTDVNVNPDVPLVGETDNQQLVTSIHQDTESTLGCSTEDIVNKEEDVEEDAETEHKEEDQVPSDDGVLPIMPGIDDLVVQKQNPGDENVTKRGETSSGSKYAGEDESPWSKAVQKEDQSESTDKEPVVTKSIYETQDVSMEDIYGRYGSGFTSPAAEKPDMSLEEAMDFSAAKKQPKPEKSTAVVDESKMVAPVDLKFLMADNWSDFQAPGSVQCICISDNHIWCVDKADRLHYSGLSGPGLRWRKVEAHAQQVAVAPSGFIVWRLHNNSIYVGTRVTLRQPAGMKWVEVAREVAYVAVDNNTGWYVKMNGDLMMQPDLGKERPCSRSVKVSCPEKLVQVKCLDGVIWGLTEKRRVLVKKGNFKEDTHWVEPNGLPEDIFIASMSLGNQSTAWLVDVLGRVWFTRGVTKDTPRGDGHWWQVSLSEYLMNDQSGMDLLQNVRDVSSMLTSLVSRGQHLGLITAGVNGVWLCLSNRYNIHVCRGSIIGHRWESSSPGGMSSSIRWLHVDASSAGQGSGLLWLQQPNGALFSLNQSTQRLVEINGPISGQPFSCVSAAPEACWGLLPNGDLCIRAGMAPHCLHGVSWAKLDLTQLGGGFLIHVSCGTQNVWAVDNKGNIYLRIGTKAPSSHLLPPAWVPVEGSTDAVGALFTKVFTGPSDYIVWAIDSRKCTYVRKGVTDTMPIGTHWVYVPGTPAESLCISNHMVYALNPRGEILVRYGISPENVAGDYWKKVPGMFSQLSVTCDDELWGITTDGQLQRRHLFFLHRQEVLHDLVGTATEGKKMEEDWELI